MTTAIREEPTLPAEFPRPKPVDIRTAVIDRDGASCRLCGGPVDPEFGPPLVNVRPGLAAGDFPELQMVMACFGCESAVRMARFAVEVMTAETAPRQDRLVLRLLERLYLENCQIAQTLPLRGVAS